MSQSVIICPQCGGENRPGSGRCIHCAELLDGQPARPRGELIQIKADLEDLRVRKERDSERDRQFEEQLRVINEAETLKVLPEEQEQDYIQMEPLPFPWQRYLTYAALGIVVIVLGIFGYKVMFPPADMYATLSNYTERAGSPLYKQVLGVVSKQDYGSAQESVIDNDELFGTMLAGKTAILIPNGSKVRVIEQSMPYTMVEYHGSRWYVLRDYVHVIGGEGSDTIDEVKQDGESAWDSGEG